jgi:cytochrome b561
LICAGSSRYSGQRRSLTLRETVNRMQFRNSPSRHGIVAVALHWLSVVFVVVAWLLGTFHDALPRGGARSAGLLIHMSAGLAVISLLVVRIPWRLFNQPSPRDATPLGA